MAADGRKRATGDGIRGWISPLSARRGRTTSERGPGRQCAPRARPGRVRDDCRVRLGDTRRLPAGSRAMTPLMLSVRDVSVQYGRRLVFERVSFDVGAGQSLGVIGANGAGKTTLLRAVV